MADTSTREQQALASNPAHSAWVSANAGSGKTTVLAGRVVRLLLAGVDPSCILCLTFTKAAAGEMANRVFRDLAAWTAQDDATLKANLEDLTDGPVTDAQLAVARTLFARALETPGGLKIQTIHAFCEAVLHRFPLEANIPGHFEQADETQQAELLELAKRQIILRAQGGSDAALTEAFAVLLDNAGDSQVDKLLRDILGKRETLAAWLAGHGGADRATAHLFAHFGFPADFNPQEMQKTVLADWLAESAWWCAFVEELKRSGKPLNLGLAEAIQEAMNEGAALERRFESLCLVVLNKGGTRNRRKGRPTQAVVEIYPDAFERMQALAERLTVLNEQLTLHQQITLTRSALIIAEAMLTRFRLLKRQRGLLDFDDLIMRTRDLLTRSDARAWVLYKLDMGIDHILVDEAQDTNPAQWRIIRELVEEFFSGEGAREKRRTIFAVGDEKQSIYSFQGARPRSFSLHRALFDKKATGAGRVFKQARLNLSFRSTKAVLTAVDKVFEHGDHAVGLTFDASAYEAHQAHRKNDPGFVEVWDRLEPVEDDAALEWHERAAETAPHPALRLADHVARRIEAMVTGSDAHLPKCAAGDIIVLIRNRTDAFIPALTRELKARNVPVAGADRLSLVDHIAVQDLMALGHAVLTPADDLSLAALLKSPLIGLDEEALYNLAHGRTGILSEALWENRDDPLYARAHQRIERWRGRVGQMPVHEFYDRVLGDDRGHHAFVRRLGTECEDVLAAFLDQTLAHEQAGHAGLHGFLQDLSSRAPVIKREFDGQQDEVRIMTVHAAKGLEAKYVFVVDRSAQHLNSNQYPALYAIGDDEDEPDAFLWSPSSTSDSQPARGALETLKREAVEESRRLLYVALTRAEDGLFVCGYRSRKDPPDPNWHDMVTSGLEELLQPARTLEGGAAIRRWQDGEFEQKQRHRFDGEASAEGAPGWLHHRLRPEPGLPRPLAPSSAGLLIDESLNRERSIPSLLAEPGTEADSAPATSAAQLGTVLHALLRHLPQTDVADRESRAMSFLTRQVSALSESEARQWTIRLLDLLNDPALAGIFDPLASRAEVPLAGRMMISGRERLVSGRIDRLVVSDEIVRIVDFKTGAAVPSADLVSPDHLAQMALYRSLISQIYPDRLVEAMLIHVSAKEPPQIINLPGALLDVTLAGLEEGDG